MPYTSINKEDYSLILISTTSKHSTPIMRLPDKFINEKKALNYLISDPKIAKSFLSYFDDQSITIFADVEKKQGFSLFQLAVETCSKAKIIEYKPNDVTLEAADIFITKYFNGDLYNKKVIIYGTGNLAFKLAMRLLEKNNEVYISGRNSEKIKTICETLKMVTFNDTIYPFKEQVIADAFISFVSAERVIDEYYLNFLSKGSLLLDGGIGNFKESLISKANQRGATVVRLDVRVADTILENKLENNSYFFDNVYGTLTKNNIKIASGGIIAEENTIVVNQIKNPTQIIGVANGIGGLKDVNEYTEKEKSNIHYVKKEFL